METRRVRNGDVELSLTVHGAGPTILLLHGWPDTSALWDDVSEALREEGYRVAAADLRGCGQSSKPLETSDYLMHHLVQDVSCLIESLGESRVTLVGHDWGAGLAWAVAAYRPELLDHLVVLSVGHPTAFRSAGLEQQIKSWYTLLFAHEGLGEAFLRHNEYEVMRHWLGHPRVDEIIRELERDGQMSAHLRWYRANLPPDSFISAPPVLPPIQVPTLGIWSSGDVALSERQMVNSRDYCVNGFDYLRLENFGHFLPLEAPREVVGAIVAFLASESPSPRGSSVKD